MKIGLIDVDGHNFPNLSIMKLSAWHKARGDTVEWWKEFDGRGLLHYDVVYKSKVFSFSPDHLDPANADRVVEGGTGYAITLEGGREVYHPEWDRLLPPEIEHIYPDYSLYPELTEKTAYGFLTRGCPRGCLFCHVAGKEGRVSRKVADLSEFWNGQKNIEIMDPNILACPDREELLEQLVRSEAYVNFNQGLDIRLTDQTVADLLWEMRVTRLHFAWDNPNQDLRPYFERFSGWYRRKDPNKKMVYVLTNFGSTMWENLYRIYTLDKLGYDPYVMVYDKPHAPADVADLQRWCNSKFVYKATGKDFSAYSVKWREYKRYKKPQNEKDWAELERRIRGTNEED